MRHLLHLVITLSILFCGCSDTGEKPGIDNTAHQSALDAMWRFLASYEDAKEQRDTLRQALAADSIASMLSAAYNNEEASKYWHEAIELYSKTGEDARRLRAESKLSSMNLYSQKTSRRLSAIDSTLHAAFRQGNIESTLKEYSDIYGLSASVAQSSDYRRLDPARDLLRNILTGRSRIEADIFSSMVLRLQGRTAEADSLLLVADSFSSSNEDKVMTLYARYLIAKENGDSQSALLLADSLIFYHESITEDIIKENVNAAHKEFYSDMAAADRRKSRSFLYLTAGTIFASLIIIFALWFMFRLRSKAHRAEKEANLESLVSMKAYADKVYAEKAVLSREIDCIRKENADKDLQRNAILESLFRQKWTTLNRLCEEYFVIGPSKKLRESLAAKIEDEINDIGSEDGLLLIEEEVNRYMDGIVEKLRKDFPSFKNKDIAFCTLIFAGFSAKAICFILGMQTGNFYVKKGRFIKKLNDSDSSQKALFISAMN